MLFWVAALLLAFIDIPDFLTPFRRIATSVETIAGQEADDSLVDHSDSSPPAHSPKRPYPLTSPVRIKKGAAHA